MPEDHQGGDEHCGASAEPHQAVDHLDKLLCPRSLDVSICSYGAYPAKNAILDGCSTAVLKCSDHMRCRAER